MRRDFPPSGSRWKERRDEESRIDPKGPLDRVYTDTRPQHKLDCPSGRRVVIDKSATLADTVVWTPWDGLDGDGDHSRFLCVEPGNVMRKKTLAGGETFVASQTLTVQFS